MPRLAGAFLVVGLGDISPFHLAAATGILDDERLLHSDGTWHRDQRKTIAFEASCYYSYEPELPNGCQYDVSKSVLWRDSSERSAQRGALLDFYRLTNGDNWRLNDNWSEDSDPCWDMWYGVTCDEHGHIIKLELSDNRLEGILAPSLGRLTSLLKIDLSSTAEEYHGWPNVNRNRVRGAMPAMESCLRLEEIEVSGNLIERLPTSLYLNAGTLRVLSASYNEIQELPRFLRRFTTLHTLELDHNRISDRFPADFGFLVSLQFVQLQYNDLNGPIPADIAGMTRMRTFDVSHNPRLRGEMAQTIIVEWQLAEWISIMNTSIVGYLSSLCTDVPFCWRHMYDTHPDMTWATAADVPDIVGLTVSMAQPPP